MPTLPSRSQSSVPKVSPWKTLLVAIIIASLSTLASAEDAKCISQDYAWAKNAQGQDPCEVANRMVTKCNGSPFAMLPPNTPMYGGPGGTDPCLCNLQEYNMLRVCARCQNAPDGAVEEFPVWTKNCLHHDTVKFQLEIPEGTSFPDWSTAGPGAGAWSLETLKRAAQAGSAPEAPKDTPAVPSPDAAAAAPAPSSSSSSSSSAAPPKPSPTTTTDDDQTTTPSSGKKFSDQGEQRAQQRVEVQPMVATSKAPLPSSPPEPEEPEETPTQSRQEEETPSRSVQLNAATPTVKAGHGTTTKGSVHDSPQAGQGQDSSRSDDSETSLTSKTQASIKAFAKQPIRERPANVETDEANETAVKAEETGGAGNELSSSADESTSTRDTMKSTKTTSSLVDALPTSTEEITNISTDVGAATLSMLQTMGAEQEDPFIDGSLEDEPEEPITPSENDVEPIDDIVEGETQVQTTEGGPAETAEGSESSSDVSSTNTALPSGIDTGSGRYQSSAELGLDGVETKSKTQKIGGIVCGVMAAILVPVLGLFLYFKCIRKRSNDDEDGEYDYDDKEMEDTQRQPTLLGRQSIWDRIQRSLAPKQSAKSAAGMSSPPPPSPSFTSVSPVQRQSDFSDRRPEEPVYYNEPNAAPPAGKSIWNNIRKSLGPFGRPSFMPPMPAPNLAAMRGLPSALRPGFKRKRNDPPSLKQIHISGKQMSDDDVESIQPRHTGRSPPPTSITFHQYRSWI